jgi:hypothetical protein
MRLYGTRLETVPDSYQLQRLTYGSFNQITPSAKLNWTSCYNGAQCARFQVLLDYQDPSAGTAAIALVKIPATVSTKDASYKGPILFNPGSWRREM